MSGQAAPAPSPARGPALALDTTGSLGSVAVVPAAADPETAGSPFIETFEPANRHAANLLPAIRRALERAGVGIADLNLFVATRGPGSFTGLRVGLATVQGLAFGAGAPAVGVSSLDAAAFADAADGGFPPRRLALVDALRGELFGAVYERGEPARPLVGPVRLLPAAAGRFAAEHGAERISGPGARRHEREITAGAGGIEVVAESRPLAPAALRLGLLDRAPGDSTLEPIYLRDPDIHGAPERGVRHRRSGAVEGAPGRGMSGRFEARGERRAPPSRRKA